MSILYNYIAVIERIEGVENIVKQNQRDAYKEQGTLLNVTNFHQFLFEFHVYLYYYFMFRRSALLEQDFVVFIQPPPEVELLVLLEKLKNIAYPRSNIMTKVISSKITTFY